MCICIPYNSSLLPSASGPAPHLTAAPQAVPGLYPDTSIYPQ